MVVLLSYLFLRPNAMTQDLFATTVPTGPDVSPASTLSGAERARMLRSARSRSKEAYRSIGKDRRVKDCGRKPILRSGEIAIATSAEGNLTFSGFTRCGSVWACEACASLVAQQRKRDVAHCLSWAAGAGYAVGLVTLTAAHSTRARSNPLAQPMGELWDFLSYGWRAVVSGRSYEAERTSIVGYVRGTEATVDDHRVDAAETPSGRRTGAHIHFHVALIMERDGDRSDREILDEQALKMWQRWSRALGRKEIDTSVRGLDVRVAGEGGLSAADIADYLAKGDKGHSPAIPEELTGSVNKVGGTGRQTPFQLLRSLHDESDLSPRTRTAHASIWRAYETASKGRRALTWSRNLRGKASLGIEVTDEVIVATPPELESKVVVVVSAYDVREHMDLLRDLAAGVSADRRLPVVAAWLRAEGIRYRWELADDFAAALQQTLRLAAGAQGRRPAANWVSQGVIRNKHAQPNPTS